MSDNPHATNTQNITPYECQACGWVYPPDSKLSGSQPTPFEQLSDSFRCALCGVGKSEFKPLPSEKTHSTNQPLSFSTEHKDNEVVIIGGGLAGWSMVDALRAKDADIGITLISSDSANRYHKPMLSAAFSQNKTPEDLIRMTGEEAAIKSDITLLTQTQVLSIDSQNRTLQTDKGESHYVNLVLAMGAMPAIPPCFDSENIWHVNHIDNFAKIQTALSDNPDNESKHIAVIGAGMVGTEIAEDLTKAGQKVTLIDMNDAPLAAMLPKVATQKISDALQAQGITFIGNSRVDKVEQVANNGYQLVITNCHNNSEVRLQVDHILISTGLKVAADLPNSAGIEFDTQTGIAVDESSLQTSAAHIYAIGDCMSIGNAPCRYVAPLRAQAATIAEHILGQESNDYQHQAYTHKTPMIRLKNKSISVSATGAPTADESKGVWRVANETETELSHDTMLEQVSKTGEIIATATLKVPK